jgi:tetratricopeptide (TPR) repeat protein
VLAWTFEDRPELALGISSSLLYNRAHWIHPSEARSWLETSIEKTRNLLKTEPPKMLVRDFIKAHTGLGVVISLFGDNIASVAILEDGIALAREHNELEYMTHGIGWRTGIILGNRDKIPPVWEEEMDRALEISQQHGFLISEGLLSLGKFFLHANRQEFTTAMAYLQKVNQMVSALNNPRFNAILLQTKANLSALQGDVEAAKKNFLEAIENSRAINDLRNTLHSKSDLAHLYRRNGKLQEALALYRETIGRWQEEGSLPARAHQLESFAYIAISQTKMEHAARLLGKARATRAASNAFSTDPMEIAEMEQAMAQLAEVLGEEERDRLMLAGSEMSMDEAVALALSE